ncbi:MAG: UDP-N-acetylmuramoyl-L-alanine--D-glutamate ligase [Acidimicrobiia bacterium]
MSRVLVLGLGVTGEAVVRHAAAVGDLVTVVEERPGSERYQAWARDASARGVSLVESPRANAWRELVADTDLVVPSPGVPEGHLALQAAREQGVPVRSEIDLAAEIAPMPIVAIAGTNGKTTVTTLTASMLERSGARTVAAGNIGRPLLDAVRSDLDVVVAEVSSFQLRFTTAAFRPRVAVLLNVADDHLDWHPSLEEYAQAKARVFRNQADGDLLVCCGDDRVAARLAGEAPARRATYHSTSGRPWYRLERDVVEGDRAGDLADALGDALGDGEALEALRPVDRGNAVAAAIAALEVGAGRDGIRAAIAEFRGLPHRVQPVGKAGGVEYYDDSKATNPHAALRAIEGFDRVVLVAGGRNKGLDLSVLRAAVPRLRSVVAIGEAADELERTLAGLVPVVRASSMHDAVRAARSRARAGDTVLLSPACASFDWYENYAQRGEDFAREVQELLAEEGHGDVG